MSRSAWNIFGWGVHALFALTVVALFQFLRGPSDAPQFEVRRDAALFDGLLALQFSISHSVLLLPGVRRRLVSWIPGPMYGVGFCFATCLSLLLTIQLWQPIGGVLWCLTGPARLAMQCAFYGAWVALFYSLRLSGLGYQTGWTTWRPWAQGKPAPRREFRPVGVYRWFRHPVYFSFLGLIWLTPVMTFDRAVLTAVWTLYIFIGSHLKDRRLTHYLGDEYRSYQAQVPGYPGVAFGPLGRIPWRVQPKPAVAPTR